MFLGGCPCCGKKGPCWKCYGKSQGECCETIMQRSGYKFCDWLTENSPIVGDLYPNASVSTDDYSFSGLFFRSVDPGVIQLSSTPPADNQPKVFARGSVDSEQNNECEFATMQVSCTHELETSGPVFEQREQTNAFINTRNVGALLDFPAILLGTGSASSSNNVEGRITFASLGSVSVNVPDDKSSVVFYPSYGTIPPITSPGQLFVPVDLYEGILTYSWFFINNRTGRTYSGNTSIEWDELITKDFCVEQEEPGTPVAYQCFDSPPGEDGWTPVGDCHPTEESCEDACPPDSPNPGGRTMPTTKTIGPGTQLSILLKWFGIHAKEKGCGCKSLQKKMDRQGPQWCRDHKDEILDHLAKEAKKRKLPFVRLAAEKLVDLAIRRAEKDSA